MYFLNVNAWVDSIKLGRTDSEGRQSVCLPYEGSRIQEEGFFCDVVAPLLSPFFFSPRPSPDLLYFTNVRNFILYCFFFFYILIYRVYRKNLENLKFSQAFLF